MIMHKVFTYLMLVICAVGLHAEEQDTVVMRSGKLIPVKGAYLQPLQERDSVLVADQFVYGFELEGVEEGTLIALPQWHDDENGGVQMVSEWTLDTIKVTKRKKGLPKLVDIKGGLTLTSFDEGVYELPPIMIGRLSRDGVLDTLVFDPMRIEVKTMPVDTAVFIPHDIKGQIRYPVTFAEIRPWLIAFWFLAMLITLVVCLIIIHRRKGDPAYVRKDPAHIVALRRLDKYRGNRMWVPEHQKTFYSGVTDTLREYISSRYGISAMEMTTSEIFKEMEGEDIPSDLMEKTRDLFVRADFVKFAKYVASDDDNASVLPLAVRFVTETYQSDLESDMSDEVTEESDEGGNK